MRCHFQMRKLNCFTLSKHLSHNSWCCLKLHASLFHHHYHLIWFANQIGKSTILSLLMKGRNKDAVGDCTIRKIAWAIHMCNWVRVHCTVQLASIEIQFKTIQREWNPNDFGNVVVVAWKVFHENSITS